MMLSEGNFTFNEMKASALVESDRRFEEKLKKNAKVQFNSLLFKKGNEWCYEGKDLEDATDSFKDLDGISHIYKDSVSFQRGYQYKLKDLGFRYGSNNNSFEEINCKHQKFFGNPLFLNSYYEGLGYFYGFNSIVEDKISLEYRLNKYFLEGYKKGILEIEKIKKAKEKTKKKVKISK